MMIFDEVAKTGSFTKAAEALGHTKSAVSQYISQLEADLGVRLLNRSTRRLNLTSAGQQLARRSEQLVSMLSVSVEEVVSQVAAPQGRLAITAPLAFDTGLVTPLIAELLREYPKLEPELTFTDERLDLLTHKLDLAISVGMQKDSSYHAILLGHISSILVASPEFIARHGTISPETLPQLPLITLPWQQGKTKVEKKNNSLALTSTAVVKINTSLGAMSAAINGLGVALVPKILVNQAISDGRLQQVLPDYNGEHRQVYALHSYQQQLPLVIRLLVERLKLRFALPL
ncbi:LysR family transcriptional regulator [Thalassomonas viridans]|uniref:LysR family transcriptional regulator n=2 Tax=Thalassomonas viridans TaxID=137584 RepID=A0AAE9ZBX8_9GAMM|nr:LysR family transcriptional regulator [Thalassomonas viridans]WDE09354.1 LysR family transcriptional regulator [Thalassomonas viridans]